MVFSYIIKVSYEKNVYTDKTFFEYKLKKSSVFLFNFLDIITVLRSFVKGLNGKNAAAIAAAFMPLSLAEGLAVGALVLSGICLMGSHQDAVQRAVVLAVAVVCTLLNGAFDALVCIAAHSSFLLLLNSGLVWLPASERNMEKFPFPLQLSCQHGMIIKINRCLSYTIPALSGRPCNIIGRLYAKLKFVKK